MSTVSWISLSFLACEKSSFSAGSDAEYICTNCSIASASLSTSSLMYFPCDLPGGTTLRILPESTNRLKLLVDIPPSFSLASLAEYSMSMCSSSRLHIYAHFLHIKLYDFFGNIGSMRKFGIYRLNFWNFLWYTTHMETLEVLESPELPT